MSLFSIIRRAPRRRPAWDTFSILIEILLHAIHWAVVTLPFVGEEKNRLFALQATHFAEKAHQGINTAENRAYGCRTIIYFNVVLKRMYETLKIRQILTNPWGNDWQSWQMPFKLGQIFNKNWQFRGEQEFKILIVLTKEITLLAF